MKPTKHIIASISIGTLIWFFTKSLYAGIICFFSGILIDLDHFVEHTIHHGWKGLTIKNIYLACEQTANQEGSHKYKRLYLVFHIAEMVLLLWVVTVYTQNIYILALAIGYTLHLILDGIGNPLYLSSYFLLWRAIKRFDADKLFKRRL